MEAWKTILVVIAVALVIAGASATYMKLRSEADTATTTTRMMTTGMGHSQEGQGGMGEFECGGEHTVGQNINWLLDNHGLFNFTYQEFPENLTIRWVITGPAGAINRLAEHIEQMECILEKGGTPRAWDPAFQLDAAVSPYVDTTVRMVGEGRLVVVKVAANECAYQAMRAHAEIVQGFFKTGRVEASKTHELPQDLVELCKNYYSPGR